MMTRWTLLLLSAWILFAIPTVPAAPSVPAPAASPLVCGQSQRVEYAPPAAPAPVRALPLPLLACRPALPPYQPAPSNRPPPALG